MDVVTEEAIGLFNYFFGIAQIKFATAGGADEVPVVHFGWVIMNGLFIFLWVYGDSARRVIQILKKISLIVFSLSSSWQDRFRNGIVVVLDPAGFLPVR